VRMLDPSITHYVLDARVWRAGTSDIADQTGTKVGSMKRKVLPTQTEIRFTDSDGSLLCTMRRKVLGMNPIYDVRDTTGSLLGRAKRTAVDLRDSMRMYGSNNEELFRARGSAVKRQIIISDSKRKGKTCATIRKTGTWEGVSLSCTGLKERRVVQIEDPKTDRLLLLAYAMALDHLARSA
jgi:uncharacterized protein YxjI